MYIQAWTCEELVAIRDVGCGLNLIELFPEYSHQRLDLDVVRGKIPALTGKVPPSWLGQRHSWRWWRGRIFDEPPIHPPMETGVPIAEPS
jgi:hypothetical protein